MLLAIRGTSPSPAQIYCADLSHFCRFLPSFVSFYSLNQTFFILVFSDPILFNLPFPMCSTFSVSYFLYFSSSPLSFFIDHVIVDWHNIFFLVPFILSLKVFILNDLLELYLSLRFLVLNDFWTSCFEILLSLLDYMYFIYGHGQ